MNALNPYSTPKPMDAAEARTAADAIKRGMNNLRAQLLVFYEREGWKALGYESWRACVTAEFGQSQRYLYRQLEAAQIEERIIEGENLAHGPKTEPENSPMGESENPPEEDEDSPPLPAIGTIPERQLRPLAAVPEEEQATVYALAKETAPDGKLTAAHVENTVAEVMDRPKRATKPTKPARPDSPVVVFSGGNPADHVQRIVNLIDQITDDNPHCKEALKRIAVHVWNRQHRRGDV